MNEKDLLKIAVKNLDVLYSSLGGTLEGIEKELHLEEFSDDWKHKEDFCEMWHRHARELLEDALCLQNLCRDYIHKYDYL